MSEADNGGEWGVKRRKVLKRDDNACRYCGISDSELGEGGGNGLHVHHIAPRKQFDDPQKANKLENLITLCPSCHKRWENLGLRMETPPKSGVEFNPTEKEEKIIDVFKEEQRANPYLLREKTGLNKGDVNTALKKLVSIGWVNKVTRGLYEWVGTDREDI